MKIALTGPRGTLGRALIETLGPDVIELGRNKLNLERPKEVNGVLKELDFDVLIHTAAITDVDLCERERDLAMKVNWLSTREIAVTTGEMGKILFYISTDYVFDGEKGYYLEWDTPNPLSFYGLSKYYGEREVLFHNRRSYIIRTSWIFGKNGKTFISRLPDVLKEENEIKAVIDQWSAPTFAPDLALAIKIMIEKQPPFGIYHISGSEAATPYAIAVEMKKILKVPTKIKPVSWGTLGRLARRPKRSILLSHLFEYYTGMKIPGYRDAIRRFIGEERN